MEDQIKETRQVSNKLYKALQNDGYKGLPSEDEFYNALQDSTKASKLYQALEDNGYQGLPDRETFYGKVIEGYGQQQPSSTDTTSAETPAVDQQKPETVVGSQQWRENIVNVPGDHSYNGKSYGEVYDQIIQEYGKNLTKQQGDPYAEARAQIMQSGITDDLRPEDADKLALDIRHGYANRYAGNASKEMVSALPDQVPNIDDLMDGLWYTRDMQQRVNHEASRLGLRKENYVNYYMKPQLAKALSDRYGYDVQSAKLIAGRLLSQDEHTNEVIRQNEAMNVVSQYAAPIIEGEFKKIQEAADKEAAPTMLNLNGTPEQKFLASVKNWQATDPETVWQNLKPMFDNMGSWTGIVGNEQLFNQISQMAEAEGIPINAYIDKYVIPSYANAVQKEFERIAVEREMPKDTYEYIVKKMGESLIGNIGKWMLASEARRRAQGEAMQLTDTGQGEYKPGFGAKVAGGAAAMLPDMVMPFGGPFGMTARLATRPVAGMAQTLITQGTRPLLARITQASLSGSASLGAFDGLKGAIEGGINPTGYEHLLAEDNRSAGDILLDVVKGGFERGIPSAVTGATMIGGPIGQKISNGRGLLANLAGWGTQVGVDAGLATAINIPKVVSGAITADDLKDEFFENIGTFAALGLHSKGKEFANLASGGRSINGVEFTKPEIESIEERYLMPLRDVINKIDEAQSKRSLITKSRLGIDEAQEKRDAITEVGTEIFNDMLYSYGVPADLKVKVCTAFNLPVPENALKPKVLETTDKVVSDVVNEGFDNKVNLDYNKPGGVLDKLKKGESLSDYELTLRLLIQDNKRYNEIGEKLQAGNQLTEDEMAFVNQYNSRIDSIQAKMFSQELDRMASDFEKRNDLKKGTIKRMFADLKAGKGVEDAYMLDKFESELNEYSKILDEVKNARSQEDVTESPIDEAIDIPTETPTGEAAVETPDTTAGAETVIEPATADEAAPQMDRSELADKLTNNGTNTIIEVMLNDGRKAYVIDGVLSNEYGRVTLADENGDVITMTDGNGYTIDRLPVNLLARDEAGNIIINEQTVGEYLGGNAENTEAKTPAVKDNLTTEQPAMSRIPVTDGVHQFEQAKPEDTLAALSESLDTPEELAETIDEQISDLTNELQQLTKAPKGKNKKVLTMDEKLQKKSAIKELQKRIDYWNSVKELQNSNEVKPEKPITEQPVTDGETITEPAAEPVAEPSAEISAQVEQPAAETTAEPVQPEKNAKQVVYESTVNNNLGNRYEITDKQGVHSEITIDGIGEDGKVLITRQDIDKQGKPLGNSRQQSVSIDRMGKALIEGTMKPAKTTDDKLRIAFKNRPAMQNLISVLNETEAADLYSAYLDGDADRVSELFNELSETHKEDMVLQERGNRNSNVEKIMSGPGNREDKLRRVRDQYKGYPDAEVMLSDEAMQPTTLEEYIAEIHSRVPAKGEGPIAYNSYETADGHKIVGLQDETGYGTKSGADTKGFKPWLAPNGKGMSLAKYAEQIHSQLPEAVQEQYSDQDVRNALISVFGGAERPSDIPLMNIRRGIMQAEQAARLMEDMVIDGNISYQKVHQRFADRLEHAVMQTNENPSDGQKKAGNYKKGHLSFGGYHYTVENPAGSVRRGTDANGNPWEIEMNNTYGYILGKKGKDGDHLDMFINDKADLDNWDGTVYVVDQVDPETGRFDEHKVMYGFGSEAEARDAYLSNYSRGWQGLGKITGVDKATFDKWLDSSDRKQKEFADHSIVKHKLESQVKNFDSALEKLDERGISIDDPELLKAYGLRNVILSRTGDHVSLTHFIANEPGQGSGTRFMEDLARLADEKGWTLALTPDTSFGARSMSALKRFYNRFGFKPNKGRYTDFETNESMVRRPKEWTPDAPEYQEQVLRDVIIDHLRDSGVEINTNWKEGQQILDRYNGEANLSKAQKNSPDDIENAIKNDEKINYFKTPDGQAYGYTYRGKIYIDPRIATAETPIHEFSHLWAQMKRETSPDEWNSIKQTLLGDKLVEPFIDKVKRDYPELAAEGKEDSFVEEVLTQFSGKHGVEKLRKMAEEIKQELGGDAAAETIAQTAIRRVRSILNDFWKGVCNMMGWPYTNAEDVADALLRDMLNGVDPMRARQQAGDISQQKVETERPAFYSNALKAVEDIRQEKGTPDQWLAMIQKNGGLKAGEDKWLGLSDWLNEQKQAGKSVTKQDILDFIRKNQIQIEETHYQNFNSSDNPKLKEFNDEYQQNFTKAMKEMRAVAKEYDAFDDEMLEKYGEGWANKLEGEDKERNEALEERYAAYKNPEEAAFKMMVDEYGDDFEQAFEVFNHELIPITDYYDEPNAAAKYFLGTENEINSTRLSYTTDGLENKREIALTVPTIEPYNESDEIHFGDAGGGRAVAWARFGETTDADGNKVLVIDEIQSKRHQDAREKGYKGEVRERIKKLREKIDRFDIDHPEFNEMLNKWNRNEISKEEMEAWREKPENKAIVNNHMALWDEYDKLTREFGFIPDAPFEKNWHELAMKRMLRYAAENGYDKIAWTTGAQQAERYDLSKKIEKISAFEPDDYAKEYGEYRNIQIDPTDGDSFFINVDKDGKIMSSDMEELRGKNLSDALGKELSAKIMEAAPGSEFTGNNLQIGGEGMKGFYDEILPRFMNKYGKKWGVKVGEINLPNLEESAQKMWSIDVTPEMRNSVMEGQPMFQKVAQVDANHKKAQLDIINSTNPMTDDIHLGIRSVDDIKSFDEAYDEAKKDADRGGYKEYASNPDVTNELLDNARKTGKIVVYSSKPIKNGNFVTPSEMMASDYAGEGRVYSKRVPLNDVAWINLDEGQYAKIDKKEAIAKRDQEYADAVAAGDKEKVDALLREEAKRKGYSDDSSYQGSIAFNGAAPSKNGYFETRAERKQAFEDGNFEGTFSLGDYVEAGIDANDLEWQLYNPMRASAGHRASLESIHNINNAIRSKRGKIKMYRAVDANVKEDSFRNGDWVTPSREYAENHIELQDWKKGRIIEQEVSIDDIWWNGDDINEWGYDDGKKYAYKNTKNNRKLLEPTYDKDGNLIPLSKRFNSRKDDIMFQMVGEKGAAEADKAEGVKTRQESLKVAEELEKADKSSKAIKFATGWERGKDGKWRYETVDEKADILDDYNQKIVDYNKKRAEFHKEQGRLLELYDRLGAKIPKRLDSKKYSEEEQAKFREMRKEREKVWKQYMASNEQEKELVNNARDGHTTKLVDLLGENHELFKYYPQLKDIAVRYAKNMQQGVAGSYNDKDGIKISIDQMHVFGDSKDLNNDNLNGILVHEIQHAIQDIEGFAKGGNLYTATTEAGINAIVQKKQAEQAAIANKIDMFNKWLNNPEELKLISQLDRRTVEEEKKHLEEQLDDLSYQHDRIGMYIDKIKHDKAPAMSDARDLYSRLAGEVEARNASERINMSEEDRRNTPIEKTEDYARDNQVVMMEYPEGGDEGLISFQKVDDTDELKKLESEPTVKRYRAMQLIDGKLYPPMSAKVDGQMRQPTEIGVWEKAEERPDLIKNGKFVLNKAQKGQGNVPAAYNPYFHTSTSGLNDQFTSAYKRPELVVVEVEIPESELTSGYKAEGAKDAVGNVDWHSGVVNGQLPADRQRQVTLSRYSKVNRVVPDSEVADMIAKQLDGTDITVPYNVVTPSLRAELEKKGVTISDKPAGSVTEDINGNPIRYQRVGEPESELTPEERQYWNKWDADMKKWKVQNALPANAEAPGPETPKQPDETMMDYVIRITKERKQRALWLTAPKLEDYQRMRTDKDTLESAREEEQKYPDSPAAKMRRIAAEFQQIRSAMSRQKAYDKSTVKAVTDFAQNYMRMGFGDNLSRGDVERMLSSVKNAVGAKTVKKEVDNIMNILTDNYLRNLEQQVVKLSSIRELRKNVQGVEVQGKLELKGQRMIQAFRSAMEYRLNEKEIREKLGEVAEKMARNDEEAPMWEQEFEGLSIALQYAENVEASRKEWAELDRQYKEAVKEYKDSNRSYQAQQELLASIENAMMENKIERIGMYGDIIGRLQGNISESMKGAHEFIEREKERIKHIQQIANFDLAGKDMGAIRQPGKLSRIANSTAARFFLGPLATFEQMLKQFGSRSVNGEGYLYNHFMRKWMDATDNAFVNETKAKEELDEKAREVFGDEVKRWSDLYKLSNQPGMEVKVNDQGEDKTLTLTQGNMLYIYMANKMNDGKMKLRKMGITEEDVEAIKEALDPRLVQLGDWIQEDYLPKRRVEYNKVYERMFGAPMATIENYFPIKVLGDARYQEKDVNTMDQDPALPSTITGNIIKRTKNALPLDILNTDAVSLALEHIEDMERWAAQAELNKDINTLLSYTTFRNKVKNMNTIYGSGDQLWNNFADTARMAAGTYRPKAKPGSVDKTISNIAKGVTAAKISFRMYTAFKQILSAPAFAHDVDLGNFIKNSVNPYGSWKWAMENMPVFQKRWKSRQVGDTRLMDDPTDWKMWKNNIVQMAARMGMSPNALVDGITCAVGARSIYESRLKKYTEMGLSEAEAEKRALQDAEIGYNLTQQSSEGAFVSAIQKDRTVAANMLSVFRNSSMAYTRQWVDAARNLSHMAQKGFKDDSIEFMTRQFQDQLGLDLEQAEEAAEKEYARAQRHELAKLLNMMFGVTVAWNLGAYLPYLLLGDDDETKKEMMKDALLKGFAAGPTEGLAAGNIISELTGRALGEKTRKVFNEEGLGAAIDEAIKQSADYEINPLPLFADIQGMIKKGKYDKLAAAQDLFNIIAQSSVGVNPQTFTDIWNAAMDYGAPAWDGTSYSGPDADNLSRPKEFALFIMRLMNAPTSSWRNKYIDELDMSADDAKKLSYEEMAKRYAHYKHWKDAPVMGWLRSDEERQEKMKSIRKQFKQAVAERMGRTVSDMNDETVENLSDKMDSKDMIDILQKEINRRVEKSMEGMDDYQLEQEFDSSQRPFKRKLIAKNLSKRTGASSDPYGDKPSADYEQLYQELRTGADVTEDAELLNMQENARDRGDEKRKDEISKKRSKLRNKYIKGEKGAYGLKPGDDKHNKEVMERYRKARRELYDSLRR